METVLPREIGEPLGHPGRSLRCPPPPRTLRSRRARPDLHERPLLCGRRQRQLLCSRGAPAAEGVEARGERGGGDRHVLHAIGSVASVGPNRNGPGALTDAHFYCDFLLRLLQIGGGIVRYTALLCTVHTSSSHRTKCFTVSVLRAAVRPQHARV